MLIVVDQSESQDTGAVTSALIGHLASRVPRFPKLVALADSRRRIRSFRGLILKMNQFELAGISDPEPGALPPRTRFLAAELPALEALSGSARSSRRPASAASGSAASRPSASRLSRLTGPIDPTGAGDSFTAGAVLALAAGAPAEAALVGNLVASVTVRQLGTTGTARPEELYAALDLWMEENA